MKDSEILIEKLDEFTARQGSNSSEWCKILDATEKHFKSLEQQVIDYETDWIKMRKYYDWAMTEMKELKIKAQMNIHNSAFTGLKDELNETEKALKEACEVIKCFQNKTAVYLTIYDGDKELRKYRENAELFLAKMEEVKNGNG